MTNQKKVVDIIIPVYNEALNIGWFFDTVKKKTKNIQNHTLHFLFVDDGSSDESMRAIQDIAKANKDVDYISFSKNFGKEAAMSAGLQQAKGDAAILIDADGQHPPELIKDFLDAWEKGSEVVIGVRQSNEKEGLVKRYGSKLFYKLLSTFVDKNTMPASTDFRLIDRQVINEFLLLTERNRMTRGLIDWIGFKRTYISFTSPPRHDGKATYSYTKLLRLALHGFVSQTTKPLQLAGVLGFFVTATSLFAMTFIVIEKFLLSDPANLDITGTAMLAVFLSFLVGLVLICQWLLALYIESIHSETQNRPLYIIRKKSK